MGKNLREKCYRKLFNTTDVCKCLAVKNGIIAFAVYDLDNGSMLSSNRLVVFRSDSEQKKEDGDTQTSAPNNPMQLQIDGRITGISISEDAKKLTVVSQEEVLLDLG